MTICKNQIEGVVRAPAMPPLPGRMFYKVTIHQLGRTVAGWWSPRPSRLAWPLAWLLGATVAAAQPVAAPPPSASASALTVLCSAQKAWCERMGQAYQEETGQAIQMVPLTTGQALSRLEAEKAQPTVDVWWGGTGELHLQAAAQGLTVARKSHRLADLHPWAQRFAWVSGYRSVGIYTGILGYTYDTEAWASTGLPAPRCWADLLRPALQGRIQIADPRTSGTAYTFLTTQLQLRKLSGGWPWLQAFHSQVGAYTRSGSAPIQAVRKGEALVGVVFLHDAIAAASEDEASTGTPAKLATVAPCEGTGYEIGGMSLVLNGPKPDAAWRFYEFALSPAAQELAVTVGAFQTQSNKQVPVPAAAPKLGDTKLINNRILIYSEPAMRKGLLDTWAQMTAKPQPPSR